LQLERSPLRRLEIGALAAAAARFGEIHARASESEASRERSGHDTTSARGDSLAARLARASKSGHLKRSFSSPPVASA